MGELVWHLFAVLSAFALMWVVSDYVLKSVLALSERLRMTSFAVSFIILGILTSMPEFAIGVSAIAESRPELFAGNLIGASFVIFTLVIPLLGMLTGSFDIRSGLTRNQLLLSQITILAPAMLLVDGQIGRAESVLIIVLYLALISTIEKRKSMAEHITSFFTHKPLGNAADVARITLGALVILFAGRVLVMESLYFADLLSLPEIVIGMFILAIGTNLPELVIGMRSLMAKKIRVFSDNPVAVCGVTSLSKV